MKKYILILCFSFIFSDTFSDNHLIKDVYNSNSLNDNKIISINKSLKAMLYSSFIPGSGQYFVNSNKTKGLIFFGLEIIAFAGYQYYLNQADNYKTDYQNYGDQNWNFVTWCSNYYDWEDTNNDFFLIFANNENLYYPDIWEDSHHIDFTYNDNGIIRFVSSSSAAFQELYSPNGYNLEDSESAQNFYIEHNVTIKRDHHFYENIIKYNHFFSGWDDHDNIIVYDNNGYLVATSNTKESYKNIYNKSVKNYNIKNNFISFIFLNHFISALDALIVSKISSNSTAMMINYDPKINFYQAQLSVKLN